MAHAPSLNLVPVDPRLRSAIFDLRKKFNVAVVREQEGVACETSQALSHTSLNCCSVAACSNADVEE